MLLLVFLVPSASMQQNTTGYNWLNPGFDDAATYFNPQNALNKDNLPYVNQDWMSSLSNEPRIYGNETARTTSSLLMINGLLYFIDRSQLVLSLEASDARLIWSQLLTVADPNRFGLENDYVHNRLINYFDEKIWLIDLDCSIKGYSSSNGAIQVNIPPSVLCGDIPAGTVLHDTLHRDLSAPLFYEKERIIVVSPSGFETKDHASAYVLGINLDTQQVVWKTDLTENPQENLALGVGPWAVDQDKGIVYIGTGSPIPEWNATNRSGANLYSDSIIALDASTGNILWHFQATTHDLNGYGCTGNTVLGEIDGKQVVYAACRNGYLYALDADNGHPVWTFDPPAVRRSNSVNNDPNKPWLNYPSTDAVTQCPGVYGAVSSNIVLAYGNIYISTFNRCSKVEVAPVSNIGDAGVLNVTTLDDPVGPVNSTIYSVDAATGKAKWSIPLINSTALKGGLTVSGGVLYLPSPDGHLYAYDAASGSQIWSRSFGTLGLAIPPVIAATARGNWTLIQVVAGTPSLDFQVEQHSGFLFMFNLPQNLVTTTVSTTSESTSIPDIIIYVVVAVSILLLITVIILFLRRRR
jgi:outer membrane protein assembly factor BamB